MAALTDTRDEAVRKYAADLAAREHPLTEADYAVGKVLAGKYRVERVIGEGAMGVVLAVTHLELDEIVALKFIRPEMQRDPDVVSRFAREAKASARIKSEHVARVHDVGVTAPLGPYIVMEYLDGQDLGRVLEEHGCLQPETAVEYVMQACEALAVSHANGITHRDIKPENLFLIRRGELELIKLLDFGVSRASLTGIVFGGDLSVGDASSLVVGTPLYMSPEQIRDPASVDYRTDIWSLGVVLYELVTGEPAFAAETTTQVCAAITGAQADFSGTSLYLPAELQAIIGRCLEKDPSQRYQSIAELAAALVPFAPDRARFHAERSSSMLRSSNFDMALEPTASGTLPSIAAARNPNGAPSSRRLSPAARPAGRGGVSAEALFELSQAPGSASPLVSDAEIRSVSFRRQGRGPVIGIAVAVCALGAFLILRSPTGESSGSESALPPGTPVLGASPSPMASLPAESPGSAQVPAADVAVTNHKSDSVGGQPSRAPEQSSAPSSQRATRDVGSSSRARSASRDRGRSERARVETTADQPDPATSPSATATARARLVEDRPRAKILD